jgi:hypothetical protein
MILPVVAPMKKPTRKYSDYNQEESTMNTNLKQWLTGITLGLVMLTGCNAPSQEGSETGDSSAAEPSAESVNDWTDITATEYWRNYRADTISGMWQMQDGQLVLTDGGGGDIVTKKQYDDFELELEWKISEGGNSGLFFNVVESDTLGAVYHSGPEYQFLDDARHPDAQNRKHRSGDNYDVQEATAEMANPAGEWNSTRLVVQGDQVEHYLNGQKIVEYELGSAAWTDSVANSKFTQFPAYGTADSGHIALQDHGDKIWFRNIRVKEL